jgi:hypothetical protein
MSWSGTSRPGSGTEHQLNQAGRSSVNFGSNQMFNEMEHPSTWTVHKTATRRVSLPVPRLSAYTRTGDEPLPRALMPASSSKKSVTHIDH